MSEQSSSGMAYPEEIEGLRLARRLVRGHIANNIDEINDAFEGQDKLLVYRFAALAVTASLDDDAAAVALLMIERQLAEWVDSQP